MSLRESREPGRMQIEAIFLEKDMEVHVLWPWIVVSGTDTFCLGVALESPKGFCTNRTNLTGEAKV